MIGRFRWAAGPSPVGGAPPQAFMFGPWLQLSTARNLAGRMV